LIDLSPFAQVPRMPVESLALAPTATMTLLAIALLAAGAASYRTYDIGRTRRAAGNASTIGRSRLRICNRGRGFL